MWTGRLTYNTVCDNTGTQPAIKVTGTNNNVRLIGNEACFNGGDAFYIGGSATKCIVSNNVTDSNAAGGLVIAAAATECLVSCNILSGNTGTAFRMPVRALFPSIISFNLCRK